MSNKQIGRFNKARKKRLQFHRKWSEGARLEAADVEPYRFRQAQTVGITTFGGWRGGLRGTFPSAVAGSLALSLLPRLFMVRCECEFMDIPRKGR